MANPKKYTVVLSDQEREQLSRLCENYRYSVRERTRARILLLSEQGQSDLAIASAVDCHWMTVRNVRVRFCGGQDKPQETNPADSVTSVKPVKALVKRAHQVNRPKRVFDGDAEARLVALACSAPPDGASRWTLQLLHDHVIEMQIVETVGKETIRQTLKKTASSRG